VAFSDFTLITGAAMNAHFRRQDADSSAARLLLVRPVSPAYFDVSGIPMVAGRSLRGGAAREVVLNESAASLLWPDGSSLGKQLVTANRQEGATAYEVVGLVKDVAVASLSATQPVVYWPSSMVGPTILLRDLSPITVERIEAVVRGLEPSAAVSVRPATDDVQEALRGVTFGSRFAWSLGLLALVLATAGAFGVFAYMV
jgi:hypothetical protein